MNAPSPRNTLALTLGIARSFVVRSRHSPSGQGVLAALSLLSVIIACVWLANTVAQQVVKETLDEQLSSVAKLAAQRIDPAAHARLVDVSQQNGEAYGLVVAPLKTMLVATPEFKFMYTLRMSPEGLRFIVDAADPVDADNDGVIDQSTLGELYEDPDPAMLATFEARAARVSPAPKSDKWGTFVSAFAPVFAADGTIECIVGVDSTAEN